MTAHNWRRIMETAVQNLYKALDDLERSQQEHIQLLEEELKDFSQEYCGYESPEIESYSDIRGI